MTTVERISTTTDSTTSSEHRATTQTTWDTTTSVESSTVTSGDSTTTIATSSEAVTTTKSDDVTSTNQDPRTSAATPSESGVTTATTSSQDKSTKAKDGKTILTTSTESINETSRLSATTSSGSTTIVTTSLRDSTTTNGGTTSIIAAAESSTANSDETLQQLTCLLPRPLRAPLLQRYPQPAAFQILFLQALNLYSPQETLALANMTQCNFLSKSSGSYELPFPYLPSVSIFPYWGDQFTSTDACGPGIAYAVHEASRWQTVTVEYNTIAVGSSVELDHPTVSLYKDHPGLVRFVYYHTENNGRGATVDVQAGNSYSQYSYDMRSVLDNSYVEIDTSSGDAFTASDQL
ncbi:hypothetical protein LB504_003907 [Fusarium proliferatum]|nr:hypothetical protein LB504_003907 [Fusarium proliferatum]